MNKTAKQAPEQPRTLAESENLIANASGAEAFEREVAVRAYHLWEERGCPEGSPEVDWFRAQELLATEPSPSLSSAIPEKRRDPDFMPLYG